MKFFTTDLTFSQVVENLNLLKINITEQVCIIFNTCQVNFVVTKNEEVINLLSSLPHFRIYEYLAEEANEIIKILRSENTRWVGNYSMYN